MSVHTYIVGPAFSTCLNVNVPCREGKESLAMKELFKVLKDHMNTFMAELVQPSYRHCFEDEFEKFWVRRIHRISRNVAPKTL